MNTVINGRLIFIRKQGGIAFGKIQENGVRTQVGFKKADWPTVEAFKAFIAQLHIGTIMRVEGTMAPSSTGEMTLWGEPNVSYVHQQPALAFPDKFHGIASDEMKVRKRYLDTVLNPDVRKVFEFRSKVIQTIRSYLTRRHFVEVETPILGAHASGANARPFQTHLNSKDADLYLRIAPETYLKRWVAAGFDKVFEIGKNFRNEGIDPSHLPEFTSVEWYGAYMTHIANLSFFNGLLHEIESLSRSMFPELWNRHKDGSGAEFHYQDTIINFNDVSMPTYKSLFEKHLGHWPEGLTWKERDNLFKKEIRPKLINPTYIMDYPAEMAPLAARNKSNPELVDMWQLVINGWEIVKCYQELVDPELQEKLLREQMAEKAKDPEAMDLEPDFLECMKYGMPPMSGLGLGIDRLVCLLSNQTNLRDVVMFPVVL